jgi:hypothetical protein
VKKFFQVLFFIKNDPPRTMPHTPDQNESFPNEKEQTQLHRYNRDGSIFNIYAQAYDVKMKKIIPNLDFPHY